MLTIYDDSYQGTFEQYHLIKFGWATKKYVALVTYDEENDLATLERIETEKQDFATHLFDEDDLGYLETFEFKPVIRHAISISFVIGKTMIDTLRTFENGSKKATIKSWINDSKYYLSFSKAGKGKRWKYDGGLYGFKPDTEKIIIAELLTSHRKDLNLCHTIN